MTYLEPSVTAHLLDMLDHAYDGSVDQDKRLYYPGVVGHVTMLIDLIRQRLRLEEELSAPRLPEERLVA